MKLITPKEYKSALGIVNKYLSQMKEQYDMAIKDSVHIPTHTAETKIFDCNVSVRLLNILGANGERLGLRKSERWSSDWQVKELAIVSQAEFLTCRNTGKGSLKELKELAHHAGVILKP